MENKENVLKEVEEIAARIRGLKEEDLEMRQYPTSSYERETRREILGRELKELAKRREAVIEFRDKNCRLRFDKDGKVSEVLPWSGSPESTWPGWVISKDCGVESHFHGHGSGSRLLEKVLYSPQEVKRIEVL